MLHENGTFFVLIVTGESAVKVLWCASFNSCLIFGTVFIKVLAESFNVEILIKILTIKNSN